MTNQNETHSQPEPLTDCHERETVLLTDLLRWLDSRLLGPSRSPPTRQSLIDILDRMLINLSRSFQLACHSGFLTDVIEMRPNWHREVEALRVASVECIKSLHEIRDRIANSRSPEGIETKDRCDIDAWVRSLVANRGHESRLLQTAFTSDIGGEA